MSIRRSPEWLRDYEARHRGKHAPTLAPSKAAQKEADLHDSIIEHCRSRGWLYFHGSTAHSTKRTLGEPDFVILAEGCRGFLVECKTGNGKLRPEQLSVIAHAEKLGHKIHVVRSFDQFLEVVR